MNLTEFAGRFSEVSWTARDEFTAPCPRHPQSRARATVDHGRINLKPACVCTADQILALSNGSRPENSANGPSAAIDPPAAAGLKQPPRGATASPVAGTMLAETNGLPAERKHVLTADDKIDFAVAHWKSQLIRKIGEVDARYRPTDAAGLAEALMQFTLVPDAPREVKRPPELNTLADEEVAGIFADLANRAWGERTLLPASPSDGAVVASAGRRAPGLRTVSDYMAEMKSRQERKALIRGLIHEGETVLMVGRAMAGKSTAACAMAHCFSTGGDFLGRVVRKPRLDIWPWNEMGTTSHASSPTGGLAMTYFSPTKYRRCNRLRWRNSWSDRSPSTI
jgi:AAA domain